MSIKYFRTLIHEWQKSIAWQINWDANSSFHNETWYQGLYVLLVVLLLKLLSDILIPKNNANC
jgi:hypothetical protein